MKLNIGYFYKSLLNLYGDNGNVEILKSRAEQRGFDVQVFPVEIETSLDELSQMNLNIVFMGGGPDSGQQQMYENLVHAKGGFLRNYINSGGVGLYICGSYQLLGTYYKASDSSILKGLEIFDLYTEHFGPTKPRCIGNVVCRLPDALTEDSVFKAVNHVGNKLVGFENHGGRTYLGKTANPLATVELGFGNNGGDDSEGIIYKNSIGSYLHGPLLARNPHLADYLIAKALHLAELAPLDDALILSAHTASKKFKQ